MIACDFDGTGAVDGRLAPEVAEALAAARQRGIATLLVTGRVLEDLQIAQVDLGAFDAIVAENGAVVSLPASERTILMAEPPPERLLTALREKGIPFHAGAVVIGTWEQHAADLLLLVRRLGLDQQLVFNRAALMLLPSGVNKAVGVARALAELGMSTRNMIAFGDAENDQPMFAVSEVGVAARGAVRALSDVADDRLSHANGEGISTYVRRVLEQGCILPTPERQKMAIGTSPDGRPVALPASGTNVLISGDPRSGKSWLGGVVAEQLIERGYRLCVLDPEGDHCSLCDRPSVLVFGRELPLPEPHAVPALLRPSGLNVVLALASLSHGDKLAYVDRVLAALDDARVRTGLPHWTMVDEAHYFFGPCSARAHHLAHEAGNMLLMTCRPSLLAPAAYATIGAHLLLHTTVDEERYFVDGVLRAGDLGEDSATGALDALTPGVAGLLSAGRSPRWQLFTPRRRMTLHVHHARKYVDEMLPREKGFFFHGTPVPVVARNVAEFCEAVSRVPLESLRHHMLGGDFSRWARGVLGDEGLAAGLAKLEQTARASGRLNPNEVLQHVRDRYALRGTA